MAFIMNVFNNFVNHFENQEIYPTLILTVLLAVTILAVYEFVVYRVVLRRSLYNKAYIICVSLLPYFVSTIILTLQSNLIVTLGTIGALAIIRFRTAVKDPVDMIFLLWSIHIGIVCGCQLYELGFVVSIAATVVLVVLNLITTSRKSHILIVHTDSVEDLEKVEGEVKKASVNYRVKSRNYTDKGVNLVFEVVTKEANELSKALAELDAVKKFSLMEYEADDIL